MIRKQAKLTSARSITCIYVLDSKWYEAHLQVHPSPASTLVVYLWDYHEVGKQAQKHGLVCIVHRIGTDIHSVCT